MNRLKARLRPTRRNRVAVNQPAPFPLQPIASALDRRKPPMGSDESRATSPHRPKAYHFDDDPPLSQGPDLGSTSRSIVRHGPPARRHTAQSQIPGPDPNSTQQINYRASPGQQSPKLPAPVVQGEVILTAATQQLGNAASLTLGPIANHVSSLTPHQSSRRAAAIRPVGLLPVFSPAEGDPCTARCGSRRGREGITGGGYLDWRGWGSRNPGISAETREPPKHKTENEDKEEAWARRAEMTSLSLLGFVFFRPDWAWIPITVNGRRPFSASMLLRRTRYETLEYGQQ